MRVFKISRVYRDQDPILSANGNDQSWANDQCIAVKCDLTGWVGFEFHGFFKHYFNCFPEI